MPVLVTTALSTFHTIYPTASAFSSPSLGTSGTSGHRLSCACEGVCKLCVQGESLLCLWFPHVAGNLLELHSRQVDRDATKVHPQSLRTNKYTVRVRPHGTIPFWVAVLDQGGSETVDQIAIFPLSSSDFLRLIKSSRNFHFGPFELSWSRSDFWEKASVFEALEPS